MSFRVTYATLSADNEGLHHAFERGVDAARATLGAEHGFVVDGVERAGIEQVEERSPADRDVVIGTFAEAGPADVAAAAAAAARFAPTWAATPWKERVNILRRGAELVSERQAEFAALVALEVGKTRLEALADVEEAAELIRWSCDQMEAHDGFVRPMGHLSDAEHTWDVMRPYGVWAVISPFNFPMALVAGPVGAALVAGNTVVAKPSEQVVLCGLRVAEVLWEAGVPSGALHVATGLGERAGDALVHEGRVDGITFTGSHEVGMGIYRSFARAHPKPVVCEMGGKNPVIVSRSADLELAAEGTCRSAFGFSGQKCSAASRVYVERAVADRFTELLVEKADALPVGNPLDRSSFVGPVVNEEAGARYERAVDEARRHGEVLTGGERRIDGALARGCYLAPTVVRAPRTSWVWSTELFVPFIALEPVDSLDEALALANDTPLGLTAGFYGDDPAAIDAFLDRIEAGVVYVNRRPGATTGAWPGVQPFGGWKGSGTNGRGAGGPYYLTQYLREQSRTVMDR